MARRAQQLSAGCCFLVALALACGVASVASQGQPRKSVPANGPPRTIPPKAKFETISFDKFSSKRQYTISCAPSPCIVSCPSRCPNKCLASCSYCMSFCMCDIWPGTSCGDPRFTGGDGNTFYFHGKKDQDFCIVSDRDLHINAHFIGNHNPAMKRSFTWVQAIGVSFGDHHLYIGARKAVEWDEEEDHIEITLDGEAIDVETAKNAQWVSRALPGLSVTRTDTVNTVNVELDGVFSISANAVPITDEDSRIHNYGKTGNDSLVHLDLGFRFHSLTEDVDGVLGQTYRPDFVSKVDITANMPIMGGAPKYLSSSLFSTDCAVSRFRRNNAARASIYASLE
ncbi:uncharacterized protein LOC100841132 [Brachypodium distachyon]|uniref:Uncharacterized protein n=1 Tax=Brachypodium distachyon TaxID=15368 RepID=I1HS26_BRADI|nr:uncharacterized protein LOC100841132 [Brachypodium distachyon]KQK09956.1 hypothetical protein BRADI_2g51190v3 [Brachypodium distachyon]|eukprot:XP_003569914.1 uncharacterized protein LOC100841132 [Brachypodium distachyon]